MHFPYTSQHNDDGLSGRGLMTSLGEEKDRSFNEITGTTQLPVILLNVLSFPSLALATARIAALLIIATLATQ